MSGKTCKRGICKRREGRDYDDGRISHGNKFGNKYGWGYDGKFDGYGDGWQRDGKFNRYRDGWRRDNKYGGIDTWGYDGGFGWGYDGGKYGKGFKDFDSKRNNLHKDFNESALRAHDREDAEVKAFKADEYEDIESKKLNKSAEDKHESCDNREFLAREAERNKHHSRQNKKYLVDKVFVYEHHRVIDLNDCEKFEEEEEARKEFNDLERAVRNFKENDVHVKDFRAEEREDIAARKAAQDKLRDLQKKHRSDKINSNIENNRFNKGHGDNYGYVWG